MDGLTRAAVEHMSRQEALAARTAAAAAALWARVDGRAITPTWRLIAGQMLALLITAQQESARSAEEYVTTAVDEQGGKSDWAGHLNAAAFAGWAADGRSLASLLELPRITTLTGLAAGMSQREALATGRAQLVRITGSEAVNAGRSAVGAGIAANRTCTGYVRIPNPGACGRCVVLAGRIYGSAIAFRRHPNCRCVHQPTIRGSRRPPVSPRQYFDTLSEAEQNRAFTVAGARAIRDGADISAVVNARRSVYTADAYGRRVAATREGTTRRGDFYRQERRRTEERTGTRFARDRIEARQGLPRFQLRTPRLLPEEIYRLADNRDEVIAMLRRFGYLR